MLPVSEVDWYRKKNPRALEAWLEGVQTSEAQGHCRASISDKEYFVYGPEQRPENVRDEYLKNTLQISDEGDSSVILLNPIIHDTSGEWEAWWFASWFPGARRYRTFTELMRAQFFE
jgi:hypothetical protein